MKKRIVAFVLALATFFPALAAARLEDVIIGVTDSSMMQNQVLEWLLLSSGGCSRVQYVLVDAAQNEPLQVDLLILNNQEYLAFAKKKKIQSLYPYVGKEKLSISFHEEMLTNSEWENNLYGIPRTIVQDFFMWDEASAAAWNIERPSMHWTWQDAVLLLRDERLSAGRHLYGMHGLSHPALSPFRSEMMDTLFELAARSGKMDEEAAKEAILLLKQTYTSGTLMDHYPDEKDRILLKDMGHFSRAEFFFTVQQRLIPMPMLSSEHPYRMGNYTYYCIPTACRSLPYSLSCIEMMVSEKALSYAEQDICFWISKITPSSMIETGQGSLNIISSERKQRIITKEELSQYRESVFPFASSYEWYAGAKKACLPTMYWLDTAYYQSMMDALAKYCDDQTTADEAVSSLISIFCEVTQHE